MDKSKNQISSVNKKRQAVALILGLVGVMILAGILYWYLNTNFKPITQPQVMQNDGNLTVTGTEDAITKVVDKVSPSVVSITTNISTQTLFGTSTQSASGTGIIISKDGYILTNKHVIANSTKLQVITSDGTEYDNVSLIGTDPSNDIAYLKINNVNNLIPAELGDSSTIRVGQQVVAIGNALGQYQNTVSSGIISGKSRPITAGGDSSSETESLVDLLQTDTAINPGNSGGPLLNYSGQVIGINTAIASQAQGIGFAIPINATKGTTKMVLAGRGVVRARLGVRYVDITPAIAKKYDLDVKKGAYIIGNNSVSGVVNLSPASKAGLKDKDIIIDINGVIVGDAGDVSTMIGSYIPGDTIKVTYLRAGNQHTVDVTLDKFISNTD